MIFISGQPITPYYMWQMDILIRNLHSLNVEREHIHVLFSYKTEEEKSVIDGFGLRNSQFARVFGYPDTRERNIYPPSERAHIFSKHFARYPELEQEVFFLHDSDLLFRELPDIEALAGGDKWYTADTRSYTGYKYLSGILTSAELQRLTGIVGLTEEVIKDNDPNAGGAQWVIKKVTSSFWSKVERDCESMYEYLLSINIGRKYLNTGNGLPEIQSWCADMWCILWNGWWEGRDIQIHDDLDFCWPTDPITEWHRKKILHYSGNVDQGDKRYFRKVEYADFPPYYDHNLNKIDPASSSYPLFDSIRKYRDQFLHSTRTELPDVTFVLMPDPEVSFNGDRLEMYISWLQKTFSNDVLVLEAEVNSKFEPPARKLVKTTQAILLKDAYIISPETIVSYLPLLEKNGLIFPDLPVIESDSIFSALFSKVLDYEILDFNLSKFPDPAKTTGKSLFFFNASKLEEPITEQNSCQGSQQYVYSLRLLK